MLLYKKIIFQMSNQEIPPLITQQVKDNQSVLPRLSESLNNFKNQTVTEAEQVVASEIDKLKKFSEKVADILEQIGKVKNKCEKTIESLSDEERELGEQVAKYRKQLKTDDMEEKLRNEIKKLQLEYIKVCKNRISVANSLNIKKMSKIQIQDRKSIANEVFRWILVAIYTEPQSKFYWPNFKEQALGNDKGKDLMERLGKMSAMSTKEEQRVKTQYFLDHQNQIKRCSELKDITEDVEKIIQIANGFKKGYNISHEIVECQEKIDKNREKTMDRDQDNLRSQARISAIQGRIGVNKSFLALLNSTESRLANKVTTYEQKIKNGEQGIEELERLNTWTPKINLQADPTETCESCRLF